MELEKLGFRGMSLLEGERLELALGLKDGLTQEPVRDSEVLLLTNQRLMRLSRDGRRWEATFASLKDIQAVEVKNSSRGKSSLVWGILALVLAAGLWQAIDNTIASTAAAIVAALVGLFFLLEFFVSDGQSFIVFQTGSAQLYGRLRSRQASSDVFSFINRFFQLKGSDGSGSHRRWIFPPRGETGGMTCSEEESGEETGAI